MRPASLAVGAVIAVAAALMVWAYRTGGDCAGGEAFRSLEACLAAGRVPEGCRRTMAEADAMLARSGPVFDTREQCEDRHRTCQQSAATAGFVPRASGFCIVVGPPERIVPLFGPR